MKLFGSLKEIVSAVFRKDTYEITLRPNQSTTYTAARDIQLPAKDGNAVLVSSGDIVNADIAAGAAVAYSKLNLSNSIVNGDVSPTAALAYSKLNLSGSIVNADISNTAAIDAAKIGTGVVSNTEFGYLDGVTSAIQTQLNGKQATITGAATTITSSDLTASKALQSDASGKVSASSVTSTELGYVSGVTSAIQTQLGNKAAKGANSDITSLSGLTTALSIGQGGTGQTTQQAAMNALAGTQTANRVLRSDGTNTTLSQVALTTDVSGTLPVANGGTGITSLGSGVATFLGTPSSANLASAVTDETGSGSLVFGTSPTLSSPQINSSLVVQQIATPSSPSAGFNKLYTKSDGILYKLDSSGNEVAVGSGAGGSGEINAVLNPSAATDTTGWTAGTSHTVTKDSSNSPLSGIVSTSLAIASSAAVALGSQTSTSGVYDAITLPSGLQNRKLKVEFFFTTPASSVGTWAVAVYQGSTKLALSTDSSGDTILPAGVTGGKFTAYFDSSGSSAYSLNLVQRTRTSANTLYITNVIVGPGIQPQGAVVGEWVSFTPSWNNVTFGTGSSNQGSYRRVGDTMEVQGWMALGTGGSITGTLELIVPNSLTIDSTKAPYGASSSIGSGYAFKNSTTTRYLVTSYPGTGTAIRFVAETSTNVVNATIPFTWAASDQLFFSAIIPIAQWAGSGTVQLAQNDVEYAWNSDPGTTAGTTYSNSTYYGYGPNGTLIPVINSTTTTGESKTVYTVQFQTPVQTGDQVVVELNDGNGWFNSAQRFPPVTNNAASYGVLLVAVNNTTYRVAFGNAGYTPAGATTYAAAGGPWNNVTTWRWRVRKSSAGAAVGFGIATQTSAGLVNPYTVGSGVIYSGFYTPTLSAVTGGAAGTPAQAQYVRIGQVVIVSGTISAFSFTALSNVEFNLTLPITRSANFTARSNAGGSGIWARGGVTVGGIAFQVTANTSSTSQANFFTTSPAGTGTADVFTYQFMYSLDF